MIKVARLLEIVLAIALLVATTSGLAFAQDDEPKKTGKATKSEEKEDKSETKRDEVEKKTEKEEKAEAKTTERKGVTANMPCSACHTTVAWKQEVGGGSSAESGEIKFDHSKTGFPLTGQHIHAPCVSCHDGKRQIKRACLSCHEDAHRGRLSQTCDQCHSAASWRNTKVLDMHRMTRFPLTGMHVLADCTECHRRASEHQWTGAPIECFTCHEKEYRRSDLRPSHIGTTTSPAFPRDCSQCHRAIAWAPARFDPGLLQGRTAIALKAPPPNHDLRFPISFGSHRTATCEDCHASTAIPRMVRCTGCHAHEPVRLTAQHKGTIQVLGSACLSCHPAGARR